MNRKIVMSSISILTTLSLFAGVTYAQLSSSATGTGITFAAETAGLQIAKDVAGVAGDFASTQTFNTTHNVFPGYNQNLTFWLHNNGDQDIPLNNVVTVNSVVFVTGTDLGTNLLLGFNCHNYGKTLPTGSVNDIPSTNTPATLSTWQSGGNQNVGDLQPGDYAYCAMNASVPSNVTSLTSGESVSFTANFTGTQIEPTVTPTPSSSSL